MLKFALKKAMAIVLIISLLCLQSLPALANSKKVSVAFLGIRFENLPENIKDRVFERIEEMLTSESSFDLKKPEEVGETLGVDRTAALLKNPEHAALVAAADKLKASHLYGGQISNNAREGDRVLLVGELYRYDRTTNLKHKFEILKYYDNVGVELLKFREEFVKTIAQQVSGGFKLLPFLVLGAVVIAGIAAFTLVRTEGQTTGGAPPGRDPPLLLQSQR